MKLEDLTEFQKYQVWIHYMVTIVALNVVGEHEGYITTNKHRIKSPEDFFKETDSGVSEGLPGHFWRFKDKIFKKELCLEEKVKK